jgi:hypothetical protein
MENARIQQLIFKYNQQQATAGEVKEIEKLLEEGKIELHDLKEVDHLEQQVAKMQLPLPSADLDDRFYQMLALEKGIKGSFSWRKFFSWPELAPRLAFASVTLIIGFGVGYLVKPAASTGDQDISSVKNELSELKEMMMLSLLEKESATERLRAVSLTSDMDDASSKVTSALIQTLNEDENVNVRLAALDALKSYARQSAVRESLIRSIAKQTSPLVQVALADLMAELQAKSSVKELENLVKSDRMPADVKSRIQQSIDILI